MRTTSKIYEIILLVVVLGLFGSVHGQTKPDTTSVPDGRYGEGGSREFTGVKTTWKDKAGKKREVHEYPHPEGQAWFFYTPQGESVLTVFYNAETNTATFITKGAPPQKKKNVGGDKCRGWVDEFRRRFATDGTISEPWIAAPTPAKEPKEKTTVVPNDKFGEGGTWETTSDKNAKLLEEVWKDKDGSKKEVHTTKVFPPASEAWSFSTPGVENNLTLVYYPKDKKVLIFKGGVLSGTHREVNNVDKMEFERWVKQVEAQFIKDGTFAEPWDDTPTIVEQPTLKTPTGNPALKPGIDPCLVGNWRSVQATSEFNHWNNGGEGVILTIAGDGQAAIDYSNMQANVAGETTRKWGGTATGRLSSNNNTLTVSGTTFEVTITYTGPGQDGISRPMRQKNGLGNLLLEINAAGTQSSYSYACDATTLTIKGIPWSSTFKRVGTLR